MANSYSYGDLKNLIQDHLRDTEFTSDYTSEILRAVNLALDDMNSGDDGNPRRIEIAYDFQKEVIDISFVSGTYDYDMSSTLSIDLTTFKSPNDLRIDSDENVYFSYVDPNYFFRKKGVNESGERMYTITHDGNTKYLKINYDTTDTLNFEYFTTDMVLDDGGTARRAYVDGNSDSDTFLFPDKYIGVLLNLTLAYLYGQLKGWNDATTIRCFSEGRRKLTQMINNIGKEVKKPISRMKPRNEWPSPLTRISTD